MNLLYRRLSKAPLRLCWFCEPVEVDMALVPERDEMCTRGSKNTDDVARPLFKMHSITNVTSNATLGLFSW